MCRFLTGLLILAGHTAALTQVYHACPDPGRGLFGYENPLYAEWLSDYDVICYHLDLAVSDINTQIGGYADLLVEAVDEIDTLVLELNDVLTVSEILASDDINDRTFEGAAPLSFEHTDHALYIRLDRLRNTGELFQVRISYGGDAGQGRGFFSGISSQKDHDYGFDVTYTLSEPLNARDWFPVKQVLEDKIDSVVFRLSCDTDLMAGSNGLLISVEEERSRKSYTWKTTYPMAYYLLSFAVSKYRDFSFYAALSSENDSVLVQNFIYDDDRVLTDWEEEIRMTGPMIGAISRLLVDYPFSREKYGHAMAPMGGGMEHQTMTTIQDFNFYLVAHELAHQWFGDYITCGNWQDIWINEGFASYFEYVTAQELIGQGAADSWMDHAMSIAQSATSGSVFVPSDRIGDTYRIFDYSLSYKKGAILLHMIRFILDDDELFFSVLRSYLQQFGNDIAAGEDFRTLLESESGEDFSCFFQQWYYGEGFPRFTVNWEQLGDSLFIQCEQEGTAPSVTPLFQVPYELEILMMSGKRHRFRMMQNNNVESYTLPVDGRVEEVVFDPDNDILETSTVIRRLPQGKPFSYGPNPVSDELYVRFHSGGPIQEIRITSLAGREVLKMIETGNPVTMDLSALADGSYLLELIHERGTFQEQIVKISSN